MYDFIIWILEKLLFKNINFLFNNLCGCTFSNEYRIILFLTAYINKHLPGAKNTRELLISCFYVNIKGNFEKINLKDVFKFVINSFLM